MRADCVAELSETKPCANNQRLDDEPRRAAARKTFLGQIVRDGASPSRWYPAQRGAFDTAEVQVRHDCLLSQH
jgi:hypothetical protein